MLDAAGPSPNGVLLKKSCAMLDPRCLLARVGANRALLLAALAPLAADFVPLPSQHAQQILAWMPDVRPAVQSEMPGVMHSARGQVRVIDTASSSAPSLL